ncbi:MAG TPA: 3'-5' exonuclease [Bacteroidia bacterium]|nr:3'-5' exonuclease [Bacteroidia bacterium]
MEKILFLDIETIPQFPSFGDCPDELKALWNRKAENLKKAENETPADIYNRAGIYAEFGRIVCISTGFITLNNGISELRIKSFYGDDEKVLLSEFRELLIRSFSKPDCKLCAHNGKEFDFPYISRRMVINNIPLPAILDTAGKKPWEVSHLDTMEMWKFGDFKSYTPLTLLAYSLGIPSPKDDIDGSMVWSVYWKEKDLTRIMTYCEKDVEALVNVYLRMKGIDVIPKDKITRV